MRFVNISVPWHLGVNIKIGGKRMKRTVEFWKEVNRVLDEIRIESNYNISGSTPVTEICANRWFLIIDKAANGAAKGG